jgi:hypothetical protein
VNKLVNYLLNKRADFHLPCMIDTHYLGTLPGPGFDCEYYMARFACPIFFSIFAYEEMLLLITAMFMEKTVIFTSKS